MFVSAAASVKKTASFNHRKRLPGETPCPLSYPYHPSYSWLPEAPEGAANARAVALKREFYEKENLKRAFVFLVSLTGKGAMSSAVFALLLNKADKLGIWNYAGMPVWAVPYVLLTLTDFVARPVDGAPERIRFIIDKPSRSQLSSTWLTPEQCSLARVPVHQGKVNSGKQWTRTRPMLGKHKIPLPFSKEVFLDITKNTGWLHDSLNNLFEEMEMEPLDEVDVVDADASTDGGKSVLVDTTGSAPKMLAEGSASLKTEPSLNAAPSERAVVPVLSTKIVVQPRTEILIEKTIAPLSNGGSPPITRPMAPPSKNSFTEKSEDEIHTIKGSGFSKSKKAISTTSQGAPIRELPAVGIIGKAIHRAVAVVRHFLSR